MRVPGADDDDPWTTESDDSWYPPAQDAPAIEVDWCPPEPAGFLWMPDGTYVEVAQVTTPFGFARWLHEQGEQMAGKKLTLAERAQARKPKRAGGCWFTMNVPVYGADLVAEVAVGVADVKAGKLTIGQLVDECTDSGISITADTVRKHAEKGCGICGAG